MTRSPAPTCPLPALEPPPPAPSRALGPATPGTASPTVLTQGESVRDAQVVAAARACQSWCHELDRLTRQALTKCDRHADIPLAGALSQLAGHVTSDADRLVCALDPLEPLYQELDAAKAWLESRLQTEVVATYALGQGDLDDAQQVHDAQADRLVASTRVTHLLGVISLVEAHAKLYPAQLEDTLTVYEHALAFLRGTGAADEAVKIIHDTIRPQVVQLRTRLTEDTLPEVADPDQLIYLLPDHLGGRDLTELAAPSVTAPLDGLAAMLATPAPPPPQIATTDGEAGPSIATPGAGGRSSWLARLAGFWGSRRVDRIPVMPPVVTGQMLRTYQR